MIGTGEEREKFQDIVDQLSDSFENCETFTETDAYFDYVSTCYVIDSAHPNRTGSMYAHSLFPSNNTIVIITILCNPMKPALDFSTRKFHSFT